MEEFGYKVRLYPDSYKSRSTVNFKNEEVTAIIENELKAFGNFAKTSRNKKEVIDHKIENNSIIITFMSAVPLEQPAKSLRYFLVGLCNHSYFQKIVEEQKGRFMRSEFEALDPKIHSKREADMVCEEEEVSHIIDNPRKNQHAKMTDEAILQEVVRIVFSKSSKDRQKLRSIQNIIKE